MFLWHVKAVSDKRVTKMCPQSLNTYLSKFMPICGDHIKFNKFSQLSTSFKAQSLGTLNKITISLTMLPFNFSYSSTERIKVNASSHYHLFSLWLLLNYSVTPFSKYTFCPQNLLSLPRYRWASKINRTTPKQKLSRKLKLMTTERILKIVIR